MQLTQNNIMIVRQLTEDEQTMYDALAILNGRPLGIESIIPKWREATKEKMDAICRILPKEEIIHLWKEDRKCGSDFMVEQAEILIKKFEPNKQI